MSAKCSLARLRGFCAVFGLFNTAITRHLVAQVDYMHKYCIDLHSPDVNCSKLEE